ncbi:somatostatin receptor type 2-like [Styela clava]|uniref:somatostatin receptor type 1-like n=1 Tax=Styela clava TaxID=7725 RepID=UPI00193ADF09|nr:somatostatin receptor type 1-like [Styela clava]
MTDPTYDYDLEDYDNYEDSDNYEDYDNNEDYDNYEYNDNYNDTYYDDIVESHARAEQDSNVPLLVFRIVVCVFGLFGNVLVIFVILRLREYKKAVTHWYVLQLAIADSLFLTTLPFKVIEDIHHEWIFPAWLCKVKETFLFLNYYSSVLFLMVMSIDRYVALCHSRSNIIEKLRAKRASQVISIIVWVSSLLCCIPVMIFSDKMGNEPNCRCRYEFPGPNRSPEEICMEKAEWIDIDMEACIHEQKQTNEIGACITTGSSANFSLTNNLNITNELDYSGYSSGEETNKTMDEEEYHTGCHYHDTGKGWIIFLFFNFIVMFVLPLIVMSICYSLIARQLAGTGNIHGRNNTTEEDNNVASASSASTRPKKRRKSAAFIKSEKQRRRITITCFSLVILFLACWLPFHSVHLAKINGIADKSTNFCATLGGVASIIAYLNSALDPYVYNFIGMDFRKRFKRATASFRSTIRSRSRTSRSSSEAGPAVRYKKSNKGKNLSSSATATTKIYLHQSGSQLPSVTDDKTRTSASETEMESRKSLI